MSRRNSKTVQRGSTRMGIGPGAFLGPLARILNVSGYHPRALQREFAAICRTLSVPKRASEPQRLGYFDDLSHVLARWHADQDYVDADGRPVPLPLEGPAPSLKDLVSRALPPVEPLEAIQGLLELKGIRRRGKRFLPTERYLALNRLPDAVRLHGLMTVLGILRTVEHNITARPGKRLLDRFAINPSFPIRALPRFHRKLKRQATEVLWRFDADMRREETRLQGQPVTRLCVGLYAFEDPPVTGKGSRINRGRRRGSSKQGS